MKKVVLFLLLLVFTFKLQAKKINGIIIFGKDTLEVTFKIPVDFLSSKVKFESIQNRVKYYDLSGKKIVLKPHEAKEIRFVYNNQTVRMVSRVNTVDEQFGNFRLIPNTHIFLKLEIDGEVKLFKYFYQRNNGGTYHPGTGMGMGMGMTYNVEKYILQKGDGELKRTKTLSFRKDMGNILVNARNL